VPSIPAVSHAMWPQAHSTFTRSSAEIADPRVVEWPHRRPPMFPLRSLLLWRACRRQWLAVQYGQMPDANDLSLEEWKAVVTLIRDTVTTDKFPYSDGIRKLRAALLKLDPSSAPKPRMELPPLPTGPMVGSRRKARR
jgi:hypothetical protein